MIGRLKYAQDLEKCPEIAQKWVNLLKLLLLKIEIFIFLRILVDIIIEYFTTNFNVNKNVY